MRRLLPLLLALAAFTACGGGADEPRDPDRDRALYRCGASAAAALVNLRRGEISYETSGVRTTAAIVNQGQRSATTCTAYQLGFFNDAGPVSAQLSCRGLGPEVSLSVTTPDPRTLTVGTALVERHEAWGTIGGCEVDPAALRVSVTTHTATGTAAEPPALVSADYHRVWDVIVELPKGSCGETSLVWTMTLEQSPSDYRWVPSRANVCGV